MVAKLKDKGAGEGEGTTSKFTLHLEDKALKTCADNAVGISVMLLGDYDNKGGVETALAVFSEVKAWRSEMVRRTRSCDNSRAFVVEQLCGGAVRHVNRILTVLTDAVRLEALRFDMGIGYASAVEIDDGDVARDEEFAKLLFTCTSAMAGARVSRLLPLWTWPQSMGRVLGEPRFGRQRMSEWAIYKRIYQELKAKDRTVHEEELFKRHLLNLVTNEQYVLATNELGDDHPVHDDLHTVVRDILTATMTTTTTEEMVGSAQNNGEQRHSVSGSQRRAGVES